MQELHSIIFGKGCKINMKKKLIVLLFCLCFFLSSSFIAFAADIPYFTFHADKSTVSENDEVKVKVNASENNLQDNIAGFRVTIYFDNTKLTFKRADTSAQVQSGAFQYHAQTDMIIGIYVCDGKTAPKLLGDCITFVFKVADGAAVGETSVSTQLDEIVDFNVHKIDTVCSDEVPLRITPPLSPNALLASLEPLQGTLEPQFSSEILEYSLNLPYASTSIEFNAAAAEDGTVKISRKTLGRGGTETIITATVTSADKNAKTQYFITVHRAEKAESSESSTVSTIHEQNRTTGGTSESSRRTTTSRTSNIQSQNSVAQTAMQRAAVQSGAVSQTASSQGTASQPGYNGDRNLYVTGNQMPAYVVGMLIACICMLVGIAALPFFKKQKKDK